MLNSLFRKTRKNKQETLSELIESNLLKGVGVALIGSSPSRKAGFIANVLAPMAAEAGESFSVVRESEGLLLEACIKELSLMGHSVLSVSAQKNKELADHVVDIIGKQSVSRPTHVIVRYPDDDEFFKTQADSEVAFLTACLGSFFRSKCAVLSDDLESTEHQKEHLKSLTNKKRVPFYLGDIDRYLADNDFMGYVLVCLSQLRALRYQSFLNINVHDHKTFETKLWECSLANTNSKVLIETDTSKAKVICGEMGRYLDAQFKDQDSEFSEPHSLPVGSDKLCVLYADDSGLVEPRYLAMK